MGVPLKQLASGNATEGYRLLQLAELIIAGDWLNSWTSSFTYVLLCLRLYPGFSCTLCLNLELISEDECLLDMCSPGLHAHFKLNGGPIVSPAGIPPSGSTDTGTESETAF